MAATMLMLLGALLIVLVNQTGAPLLFIALYTVLGLTLCRYLGKHEQRAFGLSFTVCVLVTGLSQSYAQLVFAQIQTTPDALYFYKVSTERFWDSLTEIKIKENPVGSLAVFVWNRLYMLNITLGLDNGPWVGILFNGFLVGLSAGLTIQIARYVFGSDARRLTLLGSLFASCGMFWLFGAIHIRGSFTLFVNTLLLYGFVRFLALPQMFNGILLSIILFFTTLSLFYLREKGIALLPLFCVLGLVSWTRDRKYGGVRMFILGIVGFMLAVVFIDKILFYQELILKKIIDVNTFYRENVIPSSTAATYTLIIDQSLLVRLITGIVFMLTGGGVFMYLSSVPLWEFLFRRHGEFFWIKGYLSLYLTAIIPFGVVGIYTALKQTIRMVPNAPSLCFLAFWTISTLCSVVVTSLELRHYGQFLPALLILSILPNYQLPSIRSQLRLCCVLVYGVFVGISFLVIALVGNF